MISDFKSNESKYMEFVNETIVPLAQLPDINTSKELIAQGVLTKEGGFIGIGKAEKLKEDFNKNYFTQIDITESMSIPLACKKAKLITTHPSGSYKFDGPEGKIEKLTITNSEEFWSVSKYLVVVVEQ